MQEQKGQSTTPLSTRLLPRLTLSCLKNHKVRCESKSPHTTNPASPSFPLPILKDAGPRPSLDELDRLAKAWCGMVLGFIQERDRQTQIQGAIQE